MELTDDMLKYLAFDEKSRQDIELLHALLMSQNTPMLVGPSAVGKTATIEGYAKAIGYDLITLIGSQMDATDMQGILSGQENKELGIHTTVSLLPDWQARTLKNPRTIILLDEYSNSPPSVQASQLPLLQERKLPSGKILSKETMIIGAMNPSDSAVDYHTLRPPTKNRMAWISWEPSAESWFRGMVVNWGKKMTKNEHIWRQQIVGFIRDNPSYIHKEPTGAENPTAYRIDNNNQSALEVFENAWPSRRSWDNASRALSTTQSEIIQDNILKSLVGIAAASDFRTWLRQHNRIDPDVVIEDPESIDWQDLSTRVDELNAVIRAVASRVDKEVDFERFEQVVKVFEVIGDNNLAGDVIHILRDMIRNAPRKKSFQQPIVKLAHHRAYKDALKHSVSPQKSRLVR